MSPKIQHGKAHKTARVRVKNQLVKRQNASRKHSDGARARIRAKAIQRRHPYVTRARMQFRMVAQLHIGAQFRAIVGDAFFERCLRTERARQLIATLAAHRRLLDFIKQKRKLS